MQFNPKDEKLNEFLEKIKFFGKIDDFKYSFN